jgi:hypothetical protein
MICQAPEIAYDAEIMGKMLMKSPDEIRFHKPGVAGSSPAAAIPLG